jgi:zinc transport system substrate-binding protein
MVLVDAGRDPHVFEPTPRQLEALRGCPIYFTTGLPFEQVLAGKLQKINPAMRFVAMAETEPEAAEHAHEHGAACGHHEEDPHVWMSPNRLAEQAAVVAAALAALDTTNAARYAAGAADFAAKTVALKTDLPERLRKVGVTTIAVYHPAWGHFAEAFGLEQIAVESHGQSPGARHLADFEKKIRERGVKTMLVQNESERRRVAAFARKCGLRTVVVDPLAADVLGTLRATADALCGPEAGAKPAAP